MVENVTLIKSTITISVGVSVKIQKNIVYAKKVILWNPAICNCKNVKYAGSIIGDSVVICNEIIDTTESTSTKTAPAKTALTKSTLTNFYILLSYLLITIALLIAVSISCYFNKYRAKQKHLLPFMTPAN